MISIETLLKAVSERTVTWQLADIKPTAREAKKYAAQVYTTDAKGVKVIPFHDGTFAVIFWQRSNTTNEI